MRQPPKRKLESFSKPILIQFIKQHLAWSENWERQLIYLEAMADLERNRAESERLTAKLQTKRNLLDATERAEYFGLSERWHEVHQEWEEIMNRLYPQRTNNNVQKEKQDDEEEKWTN